MGEDRPINTPIFKKAIGEILQTLKPHQKKCFQCDEVFDIFEEDINFYKIFQVPPPTLCPNCRLQRRMGYRLNFIPAFYRKTCSAPGHQEKLISIYSEQNPVKVFDSDFYSSDKWDSLDYGQEYNFEQPFFKQFHDLSLIAPYPAIHRDFRNINCEYTTGGISAKNCYIVGVPFESEDVYYSSVPASCRNCLDIADSKSCERCYDSVQLENCYNCNFCYECLNCLDSVFLYDCRNCQHCFGCVNLRNKKYCFFNQQLNKEDYENKIKKINLGSRRILQEYRARFFELFTQAIKRGVSNIKTEKSLGDLLDNCRNCFHCFSVLMGPSENSRYIVSAGKINDSMDISGGSNFSLCYESGGLTSSTKIKFSLRMRGSNLDCEYCFECTDCEYCFGCFSLRNKKFCVFNKQYSEAGYWQLVDKIKTQMLERKEYGEFFPLANSPCAYQDSDAQIEFPLAKEKITKNGWHQQEEIKSDLDLTKLKVLKPEQVPDDIADVTDDILSMAILCEQTGKPFRIMPFELEFYRKKNLPLPVIQSLQRMRNRLAFRRHWRLWQQPCSNCKQTTHSSWDPAKNYKVYCEPCYLKEIV
ncbi:MAG: hypothetical protein NTV62_01935 [Candidatus Gribaldobacteria bacterium]|nr:hypothetical protein [Candidatus Gribaldobacteria bacterium]